MQAIYNGNYRPAREIKYHRKNRNRCVVCGSFEELTNHHIIPHAFKKYLPKDNQRYNIIQSVILCPVHHNLADKINLGIHDSLFVDLSTEINKLKSQMEGGNNVSLKKNPHVRIAAELLATDKINKFVDKMGGHLKLKLLYLYEFLDLKPDFLDVRWWGEYGSFVGYVLKTYN